MNNEINSHTYLDWKISICKTSPKVIVDKNDFRIPRGKVRAELRIIAQRLNVDIYNSNGIELTTNELGYKISKKLASH